MKIPYQNIFFKSEEQAAGFPPFTRGYHEHSFKPKVTSNEETISFDYALQSNSLEAIYELFLFIANNNLHPTVHLLLNIPSNFELVVVTKTLRTLLSLVNDLQNKNASTSKIHFYIENTNSYSILTAYQYIEMSQIDTLIVSQKDTFLLENLSKTQTPIDPLYGSKLLDKKVEILTYKVWESIQNYFNQ